MRLSDEELLDVRLCDLGLRIEGTPLKARIAEVTAQLVDRGFRFRPHFWLSSTWFTPDGVPGVAIPFYLAHPRLKRLEESKMREVEGGTKEWCLRLLRHEVGHAIDNAYRLNRRARYRELFGRASQPYPRHYEPKPYSKRFVLHLDYWYAQAHPSEDFAETFAVWLTPGRRWRSQYAGWQALEKLEYVDELMREIVRRRPPVRSREAVEPLASLRMTLREHYEWKRARHGVGDPDVYDRDLRRLFTETPTRTPPESASKFLRRERASLREKVADSLGPYPYAVDQVLKEMIIRARELRLYLEKSPHRTMMETAAVLKTQTMHYLHAGKHRCVVL